MQQQQQQQLRCIINGKDVCLSKEITEYLESGRYMQLIHGTMVKTIDFSQDVVREAFNTCPYEILWHSNIPSNAAARNVVCLFPNHEDRLVESKHVLYASSYWSLTSLNKEINERFKVSLHHTDGGGTIKFVVCYGKHVYICSGIIGTIYLLWARHINRTNHGNVPNTLFHDVPVIVNMTGSAQVRGIYILREEILEDAELLRIPIMKDSPVFLKDKDADLYVCEVRDVFVPETGADAITLHQLGHSLITRKAAMARILAPTPQLQRHQQRQGLTEEASVDWEQNAFVDLQLIHK